MEGLDFGTMLDDEQMNSLFGEQEEDTQPEEEETGGGEDKDKNKNKDKNNTAEVDPENMFGDKPESVGSEDNTNHQEEGDTELKSDSNSPTFYSSIAKAFKEEGIFPDLNDEDFSKVKSADDLRELINKRISDNLDERQKRIDEALNNGVEPTVVKQYENTINYLESIQEDTINDEGKD